MKQRIGTLDGLRALAALGVLWIHAWGRCGSPAFRVFGLDMAGVLAIGGNGVDLFFVISGFCMYYFYPLELDLTGFLRKRWIRLSPAFYVCSVCTILIDTSVYGLPFDTVQLLVSIFYLNAILPRWTAAAHFWTLGVEWQYYLVAPLLLFLQQKAGFQKAFFIIFGTTAAIALLSVFIFDPGTVDLLTWQFVFRGVEFGAGILGARAVLSGRIPEQNRNLWLLASALLICTGRVLIWQRVLSLLPDHANLFKIPGFSLMAAGFSLIIVLAVTSTGKLRLILGNAVLTSLGKVSYSFYLWHAIVLAQVAPCLLNSYPEAGMARPLLITLCATALLYPLALLSYRFLEKPFLSLRAQ